MNKRNYNGDDKNRRARKQFPSSTTQTRLYGQRQRHQLQQEESCNNKTTTRDDVTYNILEILQRQSTFIDNTQSRNGTSMIKWCNPSYPVTYYRQLDKSWSCGYRNLQMMMSSLLALNNNGKENQFSIYSIQYMFEIMWKDFGIDPKGASFYNYTLRNTTQKIGAVEVSSLLSFLDVDNVVVQFRFQSSRNSSIERSEKSRWKDVIGEFVWLYYHQQLDGSHKHTSKEIAYQILDSMKTRQLFNSSKESSKRNAHKSNQTRQQQNTFPIYMQWDGHSATIVGCECYHYRKVPHSSFPFTVSPTTNTTKKYNLLVLDPLKDIVPVLTKLKIESRHCRATGNGRNNNNSTSFLEPFRLHSTKNENQNNEELEDASRRRRLSPSPPTFDDKNKKDIVIQLILCTSNKDRGIKSLSSSRNNINSIMVSVHNGKNTIEY